MMIESRLVSFEQATAKCPNGIRLFYNNAEVDRYYAHCLEDVDDVFRHSACDKITGYKHEQAYRHMLSKMANKNTSERGEVLPASIFLSVGKLYMITANIDASDGVVNENMGTLRYIKHDEHANIMRLWLEFPTSAVGIVTRATRHDQADAFARHHNQKKQLTLAALNVQSLHARVQDIEKEAVLKQTTVQLLSESSSDEPISIKRF
ncbi:hypothetical protein MRX96_045940 [Rhipicephalus microplus]